MTAGLVIFWAFVWACIAITLAVLIAKDRADRKGHP